jgi:hypothetical protein
MKTVKVVVTQVLKVPDSWSIEKEPGGEFKCLKVGKTFYGAGITWLEHKEGFPPGVEPTDEGDMGYWIEDMAFVEQIYGRMVSEEAAYKEVKG